MYNSLSMNLLYFLSTSFSLQFYITSLSQCAFFIYIPFISAKISHLLKRRYTIFAFSNALLIHPFFSSSHSFVLFHIFSSRLTSSKCLLLFCNLSSHVFSYRQFHANQFDFVTNMQREV